MEFEGTYVITFARPYKMENGNEGETVYAINSNFEQRNENGIRGTKPEKFSINSEIAKNLTLVPGIYKVKLRMDSGTDLKPILKISSIACLGECSLVMKDKSKVDVK